MRRINIADRGQIVGSIPVHDSARMPISRVEIPGMLMLIMFGLRSTSFLYQPKAGDFSLRIDGDQLVLDAALGLMPGDIASLVGWQQAEGITGYEPPQFGYLLPAELQGQTYGMSPADTLSMLMGKVGGRHGR